MQLYLDCETYSNVDLTTVGTYRYAEDPSTRVLLLAYAVDDGPVYVVDDVYGSTEFIRAFSRADRIWAHNAQFDRAILENVYKLKSDAWACSMCAALSASLPAALAQLGEALGVPEDRRKTQAGRDLIKMFCMSGADSPERRPEEWRAFVEYARQDVEAMRYFLSLIPLHNYAKFYSLYKKDQEINRRGFLLDISLANAMLAISNATKDSLDASLDNATAGAVTKATQRDRLLTYLRAIGVQCDDLKTPTLRALLNSDLPASIKELIEIRVQGAKASAAKVSRALSGASGDKRLRGQLQYRGADRTGRWAGRQFQPHNLPRPSVPAAQIDQYVAAFKAGALNYLTDKPLQAVSDCLRCLMVAPHGARLVVGDYSNIEGRVLAWVAGESSKLDMFRRFDAGVGPDPYVATYANGFGLTAGAVTKAQRQIGKVMELASGYEGGVGAYVTMSAAYNMALNALADAALNSVPYPIKVKAHDAYTWACMNNRTYDLPEDVYVACDALKRLWRQSHPNITAFWGYLSVAVASVIAAPVDSLTIPVGRVTVRKPDPRYMTIRLPSGRDLTYWHPQVNAGAIYFMGQNQTTRKWCQTQTYGGKLTENVVQAIAADLLAHHLQVVDNSPGFKVCLHVHDEIVAESYDKDPSDLVSLMTRPPEWAEGLPLAVGAYECINYRKD